LGRDKLGNTVNSLK